MKTFDPEIWQDFARYNKNQLFNDNYTDGKQAKDEKTVQMSIKMTVQSLTDHQLEQNNSV